MNKLVSIFGLLLLLSLTHVTALQCFECASCDSNFTSVTCASGLDRCLSMTVAYPTGQVKTKTCIGSSDCQTYSLAIAGYGFWIGCCDSNNCNSSSAFSIKFVSIITSLSIFLLIYKLKD